MAIQYKRYIRAAIGGFGRGEDITRGGGIIIDQLRITFDITFTADENAPEGTVDIYNLSEANHKIIDTHGEDITIDAGYLEGAGIARIFNGKIKRVIKTRVDHAFITRITITDALNTRGAANGDINTSENDGDMPVRDLVIKLADSMGKRVRNLHLIPAGATYANFVASGSPRYSLRTLLNGVTRGDGKNVDFIVDGEAINIVAGADASEDGETVVKTPENGLLGVPEGEEDGRASFKMLLEPRLSLRGVFEIRNSRYAEDAVFTITKIRHQGDNWTGKFISSIECIDPDKIGENDNPIEPPAAAPANTQ